MAPGTGVMVCTKCLFLLESRRPGRLVGARERCSARRRTRRGAWIHCLSSLPWTGLHLNRSCPPRHSCRHRPIYFFGRSFRPPPARTGASNRVNSGTGTMATRPRQRIQSSSDFGGRSQKNRVLLINAIRDSFFPRFARSPRSFRFAVPSGTVSGLAWDFFHSPSPL